MRIEQKIRIRKATNKDSPQIARILVDTWRTTFRDRLPNAFLNDLSVAQQEERCLRVLQAGGTAVFVADELASKTIVGFANGGPNRDAELPSPAELYALYMGQAHQGRGIGARLFSAIVEALAQSGATAMHMRVLSNNPNRGFYRRVGGQEVAVQPVELGSVALDEVVYALDDLTSFR